MGGRFGFSAVPRWRSKRVVGIALFAALLAETFVVANEAYAAPAETPTSEELPRGEDGSLQAPDIASARTIARLEGERVEVIGERTEASTTWALPDGTMSTGQAAAPIWVRQGTGDGTASADWAAVDPTLERSEDGAVRPKGHPADLVIAGEGTPADGLLLSMRSGEGHAVGLEWEGPLPEPRLEGPRAVYPDVEPGVDLVVEATRTGYEQFFVLTRAPARGRAPELSLRVRGEGLRPVAALDGGVQFVDAAGEVMGSSSTPLAWDAAVDAERLHPVGKPWSRGADAGSALAPQPDWATEVAQGATEGSAAPRSPADRATPETPATPPYPDQAGQREAERPGRAGSAAAVEAKASSAYPLTTAASVSTPERVELDLTPSEAYLHDGATKYPVIIDPEYSWDGWFDTWVQHGVGTDQSGSPELRLGTFEGGYSVARSFVNLDLTGWHSRRILSASLSLYEWHSWACDPRNWQVWSTSPAGTNSRVNSQPAWYGHWSTSSQTTGASAACNDGWVAADVTGLIQAWSDQNAGYVGVGLKAENETDNFGWKKFNSANAGSGMPTLWVRWNTPPGSATGLAITPSTNDGGVWTNSPTPRLSAVAHDADGSAHMLFRIHKPDGEVILYKDVYNVPDGQAGSIDVPPGLLTDGSQYKFIVAHDGIQWNAADSAWGPTFTVDTQDPKAPTVTSTDYPDDGTWHKAENQSGNFSLALASPDPTLAAFEWGLDKAPDTRLGATGNATLTVTPTTNGRHVLQVRSVDKSGRASPVVKYAFNVGRAGLVTPTEGAQIVRRVRLSVTGEPVLTHVKFAWRRGPDAATSQDIDLSALTQANGRGLTSAWTRLTDIGDYATWDAGLTLWATCPARSRSRP